MQHHTAMLLKGRSRLKIDSAFCVGNKVLNELKLTYI